MTSEIKIEIKEIYEFLPPLSFRTGDIWSCLPTFGSLRKDLTSGIVLTPACDLANNKCESITYLPILTIAEYCSHPTFFSEISTSVSDLFNRPEFQNYIFPTKRFQLPNKSNLQYIINEIKGNKIKIKEREQILEKLNAITHYIEIIEKGEIAPISVVESIFRQKFSKLLTSIITNSYKNDIHFLPADNKPNSSSLLKEHSVALFRYPMSIPIGILELAQISESTTWKTISQAYFKEFPSLVHFLDYPIKFLSLKNDFLADLISRYISMYIRLGSRDFTESTIQEFSNQIKEQV